MTAAVIFVQEVAWCVIVPPNISRLEWMLGWMGESARHVTSSNHLVLHLLPTVKIVFVFQPWWGCNPKPYPNPDHNIPITLTRYFLLLKITKTIIRCSRSGESQMLLEVTDKPPFWLFQGTWPRTGASSEHLVDRPEKNKKRHLGDTCLWNRKSWGETCYHEGLYSGNHA